MNDSERTFHELAENLPQMVWITDSQGGTDYINRKFLEYTGYITADDMDARWLDAVHPDDAATVAERWKHALVSGEQYAVEYRIRRYDGSYRHFVVQASPVRDDSGTIIRWIGSSIDVHDQKMGEEAIRRSEKLATAGRLAASVAHEINNPLEAVTNLLYLLAHNNSLDRVAREYVNTAQQELARVGEITTQMLRFHRQSTAAVPSRIADMLDSILALYRARIASAGVTLTRDYETTEPLKCLAGDLRQAFANLIGNAIDATPRGGKLRVRLRHSRNWKTRRDLGIRVTIADTGKGIEPADQTRIFEAFFTTKGITGTGLGLWITRDLIDKHSGTISLHSSTRFGASGTVFSIFLPFETTRPIQTASDQQQR